MKSIIVAYGVDRTIGLDGRLPWEGRVPADMQHFKELTDGHPVIMGRRTFDSLPEAYRPLPNRQNIVLSLSATAIRGVEVARSLDEAYAAAEEDPFVIGGADVYRQALPTVDRVYVTEIIARTIGGDAFFPKLPKEEWEISDVKDFQPDARNTLAYSFVTYDRRNPIQ